MRRLDRWRLGWRVWMESLSSFLSMSMSIWWFGTWLLWLSIQLGIILPFDFHVFQRGRYTTNQQSLKSLYSQMFPNLKKMHTLSGKASKDQCRLATRALNYFLNRILCVCFPFLHLITLLHINSVKGSNGKGPGSELMVPGEDHHQDRVRDCPAHRMLRRRLGCWAARCWPSDCGGYLRGYLQIQKVLSVFRRFIKFHPDWRLVCASFLRPYWLASREIIVHPCSPLKWPKLIQCWKRLVPDPFFCLVQLSLGQIRIFTGGRVTSAPNALCCGVWTIFWTKITEVWSGKSPGLHGKIDHPDGETHGLTA